MIQRTLLVLVLVASASRAFAQANNALSNLSATSINTDLTFADGGGIPYYLQVQGSDNLVLQTVLGGVAVYSGDSVLLNAGNNGQMLLYTNNGDLNIESNGGDTLILPGAGSWLDVYGDRMFVGSSQGLQLSPTGFGAPTCDSTSAGTMYYAAGGTGVADQLQVCMKAADDSYSWKNVNF